MIELNRIYNEDVTTGLDKLIPNSIQCCVTSPPYYGLRDYKLPTTKWPEVTFSILGFPVTIKEQECCLGLEKTPMEFVGHIVLIFRKVKEALRDDGTLWLNFGDSYAGSWGNYGGQNRSAGKQRQIVSGSRVPNEAWENKTDFLPPGAKGFDNIKSKDLMGVPWMVAYALRDDGWFLRSEIIWHKPNPMPESVIDRPTKSHEYIFLLSKSNRYYYDHEAIKTKTTWGLTKSKMPDGWDSEKGAHGSFHRNGREKGHNWNGSSFDTGKTGEMKQTNGHLKELPAGQLNIRQARTKQRSGNKERKPRPGTPEENTSAQNGSVPWEGMTANKRTVWTVATQSFKEAHFATFPEELIIDCIKAGCPVDGIVLDPFMGAATTALVARKLNRNYIGFELNPDYCRIAEKRLHKELGMFV